MIYRLDIHHCAAEANVGPESAAGPIMLLTFALDVSVLQMVEQIAGILLLLRGRASHDEERASPAKFVAGTDLCSVAWRLVPVCVL